MVAPRRSRVLLAPVVAALAAAAAPGRAQEQVPRSAPAAPAASRLRGSRPNILFVFSDDHAAHAISAYGSRINTTPQIDRLAQGGLLFRNNYCGNSLCGPSRATILTGKHSHANGFMRNGNRFDPAQPTFVKALHDSGYQTAIFGKWHLESDPQGFDRWMVLPGQGHYYNPDFLTPDGRVRLEGHVTDLTTDLALRWLEDERDPERPFVLMCQHKAPHRNWMPAAQDLALYRDVEIAEPATLFDDLRDRTPALQHQEMTVRDHLWLAYDLMVEPAGGDTLDGEDRAWPALLRRMTDAQREPFLAAFAAENDAFRADPPEGRDLVRWKYQRYVKNYLRCVAGVDRSVGRLLDWLAAHPEVERNTLVVYASDQGFYLGDHGLYDKRWMYEESFRMPLLMRWPGRIEAGAEVTQLTQNIDFAPTFLELAGLPVPGDVHGRSLLPLLAATAARRAEVAWRDALYYHYYESQAVHMVPAHYGITTGRWKLVRYYEPQWRGIELFDLRQDPDELRSVAGDPENAEVLAGLQRRLDELRALYGDDTGVLEGEAFPVTAGIARAVRDGDDGAMLVRANATGGYLLQTAVLGSTRFSTTLRPVAGRRQQNGFVLATAGEPRRDLVRAGIEFTAGRLVIVGPDGMQVVAQKPVQWDGTVPVELEVVFDLAAHRVTASALGERVEAELPAAWRQLDAFGYGVSNAETRFGPLLRQPLR